MNCLFISLYFPFSLNFDIYITLCQNHLLPMRIFELTYIFPYSKMPVGWDRNEIAIAVGAFTVWKFLLVVENTLMKDVLNLVNVGQFHFYFSCGLGCQCVTVWCFKGFLLMFQSQYLYFSCQYWILIRVVFFLEYVNHRYMKWYHCLSDL